jgi:hypothetical protein
LAGEPPGEEEAEGLARRDRDLRLQTTCKAPVREAGAPSGAGPPVADEGVAGGDRRFVAEPAAALDREDDEFGALVGGLLADQRLAVQAARSCRLSRWRGWPVATPPDSFATCG